jgi:hypothetical protein
MDMDKNFYVCAVSSVPCNGTSCKQYIITLQRNVDGERLACVGRGRVWGLAASTGLLTEIYMFILLERA